MGKFSEYILEQEIDKEDRLILEFANLGPNDHNFGVDVKLHIMQPDKKLKHGPRVKVYTGSWKSGPNFTITASKNPKVIGDYSKVVSTKELQQLIKSVEKYREVIIKFWNDSDMSVEEFSTEVKNFD